jgi:hypothetical protein
VILIFSARKIAKPHTVFAQNFEENHAIFEKKRYVLSVLIQIFLHEK